MSSHSAISIYDDFTAGQSGVAVRAADLEAAATEIVGYLLSKGVRA